ncbi:MAG: SDR family oxidoreductase [Calditrichaeota bacterium]|nr:MAG: SDR family oxidoreductase [Calditrichota bacterium]
MRILFLGGTGIISSACTELALERGADLYLLNRGQSIRPVPAGAHVLTADAREKHSLKTAIGKMSFDVVVDWIAFTPEHIRLDLEVFRGRCGQFVFISSASAYQTPPAMLPVTEETPLDNPYWQYSRDKIACENMLMAAFHDDAFPTTIVRPSHTFDKTLLPCRGGWTTIDRMRRGKPIFIHGDGTSIWTLTHHRDFARGFVGLLGNSAAIGQAFHITSDEWLTWNQIYELLAQSAGASLKAVHVPSEIVNHFDRDVGDGLLGDKMHSMIFDNRKIKQFVPDFHCSIPFHQGAREIIDWYDLHPQFQKIDHHYEALTERLIAAMGRALNE